MRNLAAAHLVGHVTVASVITDVLSNVRFEFGASCHDKGGHLKTQVKNDVIEFAKTLNTYKDGIVNSFTVTHTRYSIDKRKNVALKKSEIKYEVKCRDRLSWNEFASMLPYVTIIVIAIVVLLTVTYKS